MTTRYPVTGETYDPGPEPYNGHRSWAFLLAPIVANYYWLLAWKAYRLSQQGPCRPAITASDSETMEFRCPIRRLPFQTRVRVRLFFTTSYAADTVTLTVDTDAEGASGQGVSEGTDGTDASIAQVEAIAVVGDGSRETWDAVGVEELTLTVEHSSTESTSRLRVVGWHIECESTANDGYVDI